MVSPKIELAQLQAQIAAARQRHSRLTLEIDIMAHGGGDPSDLEVALLETTATIIEIEERIGELQGVPAAAPAPIGPHPAEPEPEYVDTPTAAEMLGVSADTLERLRTRGDGPPFTRIGRRVVYSVAGLRGYGTVQSRSTPPALAVRPPR